MSLPAIRRRRSGGAVAARADIEQQRGVQVPGCEGLVDVAVGGDVCSADDASVAIAEDTFLGEGAPSMSWLSSVRVYRTQSS